MKARLVRHSKVIGDDGSIVEMRLWEVPVAPDKPHGFKYSLAYIVKGKRAVCYDNGEGKGDHIHYYDKEVEYKFRSIDKLVKDFLRDIKEHKK